MDHKSWLWRKKSSEKTILATNKVGNPIRGTEEVQKDPTERGVGSETGKTLNEKLALVILDCHVEDDPVKKDVKITQETMEGQDQAEPLKQELDEALKKGVAANERFSNSGAALKECKQQLGLVQEDLEQKIHDAVIVASREYEKAQNKLEEKLTKASKQLTDIAVENSNLTKALLVKEKVVEDLNRHKSQSDAEFSALMTRLDSTEKENAFLKYEYHMLEKELRIRNEEMEYYCQSADALQEQHLECVKKITMLEQECQRLRFPMRKRLPCPPSLSRNMKSEVPVNGRNQTEIRRKKLSPTKDLIVRDSTMENSTEILSKDVNFVCERLRFVEEENEALKKILNMKSPKHNSSRAIHAQAASRSPGADNQLVDLSKGQKSMELSRCRPLAKKLFMSSDFDMTSENGFRSSGSWASALISELEHFKNGKLGDPPNRKAFEGSDISLMDDFVEMEKLAIVSAHTLSGNSHPNLTHGDMVPVAEVLSHCGDRKMEQHKDDEKSFDWLQVVLHAMIDQKHVSKRSLEELLEDINFSVGYINQPRNHQPDKPKSTPTEADLWNSPKRSPVLNSLTGALSVDTSVEVGGNWHIQHNLSKSICKIIKLIQDTNPGSLVRNFSPDKPSATSADYFIRVFQWKWSELNAMLQKFINTSDDLLNGKACLEDFAEEAASTLEWILNNHVTPKEAVSARDKIKKHFGWDDTQGGNDEQVCLPTGELDVVGSEKQSLGWPLVAFGEGQQALIQVDKIPGTLQEENKKLKNELKNIISVKNEMEAMLHSATEKNEALMKQLQESQEIVGSLQAELETVKETKGSIEDEIENEKLISEDLDTQLSVAKAKLKEVYQKVSSLEVELEDKRNCCEELEATCLELQLQLESDATKETTDVKNQEEKQSQNGWEITTASAKLAECQETIVNLGKQLKALASPREAALLDKVFSTTSSTAIANKDKRLSKRSSLRDQMLAEDDVKAEVVSSQNVKETSSNVEVDEKPSQSDSQNATDSPSVPVHTLVACHSSSCKTSNNSAGPFAIVPSKKKGGFDLLLKLLRRRKKKGQSHKSRFPAKV
ncbi:filament-like plant protein 7 [Humulus lupulus]|uniref:filament-like plant protein 7 n=1 Tax=Humulus lupulus TaxID=3486 RepID=UPI002B40190E|nr:filament-like plant protein 7 [Humulus lupulus]XP_062090670.1 filament-like plant protein 7 [Humulus lupulus]XP_062090677.1 filament-like plant protein 7 [Humulus lupulus]